MPISKDKKTWITITVFILIAALTTAIIIINKNPSDNTSQIELTAPEYKSLNGLSGRNGKWSDEDSGLKGQGSGDCFAMSETSAKDFIFEAKVNILNGNAASLVFRSNEQGSNAYVANVDLGQKNARIFKFTGSGAVTLGEYKLPDPSQKEYTIRVEALGNNIKYILNNIPIINCADSDFPDGILGLLICNSESIFQDIKYCTVENNTSRITGLEIENVVLSPAFDLNTFTYSAKVPYETDKISLKANSQFNIFINNTKTNGNMEIPLQEGDNIIMLNAENGMSTQVNVKRATNPENYYQEKYRPQYHVTPEVNWLNDPNGMVYYKGEYHLFYQYFPDSKFPADIKYWAHVKSTDLVHWEECPVAISPDQNGSIWSGSAVVDFNNSSGFFDDTPDKTGLVAFYTSVTNGSDFQQQSIAYSKDDGMTWIKYNEGLPVITNADDPLHNRDFRDPKVFWHEESNQWMMVIAGGPLRFFSSSNLIDWKPEGMQNELHTECPDFFKLPVDGDSSHEKWVLSRCGVTYMIGDFKKTDGVWKFIPDSNRQYDFNYGPDVYAAQTFSDIPGRRIKVDWMTNISYPFENGQITDPWNGALTIPYEMELRTIDGKIKLVQYPVKELDSLHRKEYKFDNIDVASETENPLKDLSLDKYEIKAVIDINTASEFGFKLRTGDDEYTLIKYDTDTSKLTIDRSKSGKSPKDGFLTKYSAKVEPIDDKIKLQIFVDWSSIELFAQDGAYPFTVLVYPEPSSTGLEFYSVGGTAKIQNMSIYELSSIYNNR